MHHQTTSIGCDPTLLKVNEFERTYAIVLRIIKEPVGFLLIVPSTVSNDEVRQRKFLADLHAFSSMKILTCTVTT